MRFFMQSGVCRRIMAPSRSGDEAALVHWVQDANETPSGRRHIGACNKKAGVRGSVSLTLPRATSEAPVPSGTYRAPGRYEGSFFCERLIELAARDLGIDSARYVGAT